MLASIRQALGDGKPLVFAENEKNWTKWQAEFDKAFANPAREPEVGHNPTVKAALFVMHDTTLLGWLKPEGENLVSRLLKLGDAESLSDELYIATLSRRPSDEERVAVSGYLVRRADQRERAIGNLVWGLLASNEFCANH
jgi:hypothetical protein